MKLHWMLSGTKHPSCYLIQTWVCQEILTSDKRNKPLLFSLHWYSMQNSSKFLRSVLHNICTPARCITKLQCFVPENSFIWKAYQHLECIIQLYVRKSQALIRNAICSLSKDANVKLQNGTGQREHKQL